MTDSLQRHRRNVTASSVVLLALCLGGVQIEKLSFAGMTFGAFKKPEIFLFLAWIAFLYLSYRYVVYFVEDGLGEIRKIWWRELEHAVNPRIESLVRMRFSHPNEACLFSYAFVKRDGYVWNGQAYIEMQEGGIGKLGNLKEIQNVAAPTPQAQLLFWEAKGCLRFFLLTPVLTEYVVPFALIIGTLVYCGFLSDWAGGFRALLA